MRRLCGSCRHLDHEKCAYADAVRCGAEEDEAWHIIVTEAFILASFMISVVLAAAAVTVEFVRWASP